MYALVELLSIEALVNLTAGNNVTTWMLPLALIACMAGIASTFPGMHHLTVWRPESLAAAAASALIAWVLTMLAMA
jgi:hypothetical protein